MTEHDLSLEVSKTEAISNDTELSLGCMAALEDQLGGTSIESVWFGSEGALVIKLKDQRQVFITGDWKLSLCRGIKGEGSK